MSDERKVYAALMRANATAYGLAGGVFTQNFKRAHQVANRLQAIGHFTPIKSIRANLGDVEKTY